MSILLKNSVKNYRLGTIEDTREIQPIMNAYNTNPDQIEKRIYASQFATRTVIATGTVANGSTQPILADKYVNNGSVFKYGSATKPTSVQDTTSVLITAASASDGVTLEGLTFDASADYVCFLAKPSTAMTITFVLRSSTGNERSFAFASSSFTSESNGYVRYIAQNAVGTYTGVTVADTGTFVSTGVTKVDVTLSVAGNVELYDIQTGSNMEAFLGHQLGIIFECLDEVSWTDTLETADRKCGLYTVGKSATGLSLEITLKVRTSNAKNLAAAKGEVIKRDSVDVMTIQNASAGGFTSYAVTAGVVNIAGLSASRIGAVSMDGGVVLDRVESVSLVTQTSYHYNSTTGDFTFSTVYNGQIPTIIYVVSQVANYFDRKNLKTGFVGQLNVQRKSDTGKTVQWQFPEVEITNVEMSQEDSEPSYTYTLTAIPFVDGTNYRFYRQIEL